MLTIFKNKSIFFISNLLLGAFNLVMAIEISEISYCGIPFEIKENSSSSTHYIVIHGDEQTAKILINEHIKKNKGKAFIIKSKDREVTLGPTIVDPNRLFSNIGARKALKNFKADWIKSELDELLTELKISRKNFLDSIFPSEGGLLIALHNNFRGYNVNSELKKSQLFSIKKNENPRDFIICTNDVDYEKLKNGPYNIVLQNVMNNNNDGSLSWAAIQKGVRYINIETRLGWLSMQRKMLNFVEEKLN